MHLFEKKTYNKELLLNSVPRRPNIDEMARGKFFDADAMKRRCERLKSVYSESTRGYTPNRLNKHTASIPYEFVVHPEFKKYFQAGMDKKERAKHLRRFLQMFPKFKIS